jgi:hypothetical protein
MVTEWKRYRPLSRSLPALIELNLPVHGASIYDAQLVRELFHTALFPDPVRITKKGALSYVLLDPDIAQEVVTELTRQLAILPAVQERMADPSGTTITHISQDSASTSPRATSEQRPVDPHSGVQKNELLADMPVVLSILRSISSDSAYRIELAPVRSCDENWKGGDEKLKSFPDRGCRYTFLIRIPYAAKDVYTSVLVGGRISADKILCSPNSFGTPTSGIEMKDCTYQLPPAASFKWSIDTGAVQTPDYLRRTVEVAAASTGYRPAIVAVLAGTKREGKQGKDVTCWCWPTDCTTIKDYERACRSLLE